ncbi:N-acetyltransferase family protein [bacterium]|nr:N-acetyltransferase family protein [bacterium]
MPSEPQIFDFTTKDAPAVAQIYNESIRAGNATMDDEQKSAADILTWVQGFNDREAILVLKAEDETLAWGIIKRYSDRGGYRFACETAVYVKHRYKGKRLGSKIKTALIERCKQYGYHHLVAKIFADNEASIEYNRKFGYEVVGRQKEIGFKNGKWQDVVIMQLVLRDVMPEGLIGD